MLKVGLPESSRPNGDVDVVVVGTGAGGAPVLAELARAGLRVVALEAGRHWTPDDYVADEIAASADINWMGERISGGRTPEAFGPNNSGIGVGGSTLHWGAFCPRPAPADFRLRTDTEQGEDWPLTTDDLKPYLERAEHALGVSGPAFYPWDEERRYALPPVPRNAAATVMAGACAQLGIRATDAPAAVLSRARTEATGVVRGACINCGHCHQGCRTGAKGSTDLTFLPDAIRHGAMIRAECTVHGFERDDRGALRAVIYRGADGQDHRQACGAVFLCAGAIETPRLLLHARLGNGSGMVGRNYMAHLATQIWGRFEADMRPNKGYPSALITEDYVRCADGGFAGGYLLQSLGMLPVTWATSAAASPDLRGADLVRTLASYNGVAGIGMNGECLPSDGNFLELVDEYDALGMPKVRIQFSRGANEEKLDAHARHTMRAIWTAAGATDIWEAPRSAHTIGTCRMGTDPGCSVVDRWGRSHEIPNLWICDNSVFPSALAANPALTIMALSLRSARAFLEPGTRMDS